MNHEKVDAARKTIETLVTPLDFALWEDGHPNEDAWDQLQRDIENQEDPERFDPQ